MEVIPAIDLHGGRVVRLLRGSFDAVTTFEDAPAALADRFAEQGARSLHVVDLDGARGGRPDPRNASQLAALVARDRLRVQAGGGLRDAEQVEAALALGVARVVLGTLAVREPQTLAELLARHGDRICVAADTRGGAVRVAGWLESAGEPAVELVARFAEAGVRCFLVTAIERDGTLEGPDLDLLRAVRAVTDAELVASGGVGSLDHLRGLAAAGCDAVVVGRALLAGAFELPAAIEAARS
jgi:phosphoribosylformimino-5-aminoimidazole carboxamide ribotide isomerase